MRRGVGVVMCLAMLAFVPASSAHADDVTTVEVSDPVGDVTSPGGDIVSARLDVTSWLSALTVTVTQFRGPLAGTYGPDQLDSVRLALEIDVDGDGVTDQALRLGTGGDFGLSGSAAPERPGCSALAMHDRAKRTYVLQFSTSCVPRASVRWRVDVGYTDFFGGTVTHDLLPDNGWAGPTSFDVLLPSPPVPVVPTGCVPTTITPPGPATGGFTPLEPARLMDTRAGATTVDCAFAGAGLRAAGSTTELAVAGRGGASADATAAVLNVVATDSALPGYLTVFPCGQERPLASNVNFSAHETIPNAVLTPLGTGGRVCISTSVDVHLVVDLGGTFAPGSSFRGATPARVLDTRPDGITVDGAMRAIGRRAPGSVTRVPIAGRAGVPSDAEAVVVNVTATEATTDGYLTVFPCGAPQPLASNVNFRADAATPNAVVAAIGDGGDICVFTNVGVHVVVDVNGWFVRGGAVRPVVPARLLETRSGLSTVDGVANGEGRLAGGDTREVIVTGRGGVPAEAAAVVLNVTVTGPEQSGFVTAYPCGAARPWASHLNFVRGSTVANTVLAKVGLGGRVCLFSNVATDLVVDVDGFVAPPTS